MMAAGRQNPGIEGREREVLEAVVRLNIETGRNVSSGLVERALQRSYSSATIRTVMKHLEELGFLEQPHTSAGRLPTDAGYRIFVDSLCAGWALRRHEAPRGMEDLVNREVKRSSGSQDRIKMLAGVLSQVTENISIVAGPQLDTMKVARVEFYPRSGSRTLMVAVMEGNQVRTGLVELSGEYPDQVVAEAGCLLAERMAGRTAREIRERSFHRIDLEGTPVTRCLTVLAEEVQDLFQDLKEGELELEGVSNVLENPEFREPEPLRALIRFLDSPRDIRASLDRLRDGSREGFGVWIGKENPVHALRGFSILTGKFEMDGRTGMLAVIGPRRMAYQRAFHGIDMLRRSLSGGLSRAN